MCGWWKYLVVTVSKFLYSLGLAIEGKGTDGKNPDYWARIEREEKLKGKEGDKHE